MTGAAISAPFPRRAAAFAACLVATLGFCAWRLDFTLAALFAPEARRAAAAFAASMWPPRLDGDVLRSAGAGVVQTLSLTVAGTTIGVAIGVLLMAFSCRTLFVEGPLVAEERRSLFGQAIVLAVHHAARLVANVLRTIPYLVWAVLLIFMVGLGPFPGALAIGLHTGGVLARLFSTALDQIDPRPLEALRSTGAGRTSVFLFGMLPAVRPALASYTLYRFEVNVRESAVLGLVGAGGLGFHVKWALGTFDHGALSAYIVATMALVLLVDAASARLRRSLT